MRNIVYFITIFAFTLGIIAPACGFAWGGRYSVVEICTANGIESKIVAHDEEPNAPPHQMMDECEFCFSNKHFDKNVMITASSQRHVFQSQKIKFLAFEDLYLTRHKGNISPRGPPALV